MDITVAQINVAISSEAFFDQLLTTESIIGYKKMLYISNVFQYLGKYFTNTTSGSHILLILNSSCFGCQLVHLICLVKKLFKRKFQNNSLFGSNCCHTNSSTKINPSNPNNLGSSDTSVQIVGVSQFIFKT